MSIKTWKLPLTCFTGLSITTLGLAIEGLRLGDMLVFMLSFSVFGLGLGGLILTFIFIGCRKIKAPQRTFITL